MSLKAAIIGCGRPKTEARPWGGQAQRHVAGFKAAGAQLVALSDIATENLEAFQAEHGGDHLYLDYHEMLAKEELDLVSICTWPGLHKPMVLACAEAGVRAIHCEKPVALNYGDAKEMVAACDERGVQLTFNHQRRFGASFVTAKNALKSGAIGDLRRVEMMCSNLYDWGTHWFDMANFYNDDTPVEWVLGQIEWRNSGKVFGAPVEKQGLSHFRYQNGVHGLLVTGYQAEWGMQNRLIGTKGIIEVGDPENPNRSDDIPVTILDDEGRREASREGVTQGNANTPAIIELIEALQAKREPELSGRRALKATELIFATYESSRRRGRVELPLDVDDSALQALLDEA